MLLLSLVVFLLKIYNDPFSEFNWLLDKKCCDTCFFVYQSCWVAQDNSGDPIKSYWGSRGCPGSLAALLYRLNDKIVDDSGLAKPK